jgi:hypothetical protein
MHSSALFRSQYQREYNGFELEIFSPPTKDVRNSIKFIHYYLYEHFFYLSIHCQWKVPSSPSTQPGTSGQVPWTFGYIFLDFTSSKLITRSWVHESWT